MIKKVKIKNFVEPYHYLPSLEQPSIKQSLKVCFYLNLIKGGIDYVI